MWPSCAISVVLWKPDVLEPFVTVFLMIWDTGKILQLSRWAIWSVIFRAS